MILVPATIKYHQGKVVLVLFMAVAIAGGVVAFPASFVTRTNVIIGCMLFPFSILLTGKQRFNFSYFALVVIFCGLTYLYHVRMFYFFMLVFSMLFLLELVLGNLNAIILFLVLLMSPFFEQIAVIMGFSFRLRLTQWAGAILSYTGFPVSVEGNTMLLEGVAFTVDEACAGLNMLALSMLMGLFLIVYRYRYMRSRLPFYALSIFFAVAFILNLVTNLFRILMLVAFRIMPDDPMHGIAGLVLLMLYVIVPLFFFSSWLVKRYGIPVQPVQHQPILTRFTCGLLFVICGAILFTARDLRDQRNRDTAQHVPVSYPNLTGEKLKDGITCFTGNDLLIYVKPIPEFFSGEHTPLLCWKGSGYTFAGVKKIHLQHKAIYTGVLRKDNDVLHTAWWYSNGKVETVDQADWRFRMFKGEDKFCLVNVTANDEATLLMHVNAMFENKLLTISK